MLSILINLIMNHDDIMETEDVEFHENILLYALLLLLLRRRRLRREEKKKARKIWVKHVFQQRRKNIYPTCKRNAVFRQRGLIPPLIKFGPILSIITITIIAIINQIDLDARTICTFIGLNKRHGFLDY